MLSPGSFFYNSQNGAVGRPISRSVGVGPIKRHNLTVDLVQPWPRRYIAFLTNTKNRIKVQLNVLRSDEKRSLGFWPYLCFWPESKKHFGWIYWLWLYKRIELIVFYFDFDDWLLIWRKGKWKVPKVKYAPRGIDSIWVVINDTILR